MYDRELLNSELSIAKPRLHDREQLRTIFTSGRLHE
jgi:hypothetical protein